MRKYTRKRLKSTDLVVVVTLLKVYARLSIDAVQFLALFTQEDTEYDANEAMKQLEEVAAQLDEVQRSKAEGDLNR